jgi:hypothetical protein
MQENVGRKYAVSNFNSGKKVASTVGFVYHLLQFLLDSSFDTEDGGGTFL